MDTITMINASGKTLRQHHQGQSMIEFALILPSMVFILAGIFDLGRAFYSSITITNSAREGARYGSLNPKLTQGICNAAIVEAQGSGITLNYSNIKVSCSATVTCLADSTPAITCSANQPITVKVSYNFDQMLFRFFFPTGINMERKVEMLVP
jgi:Flp pilus assembly protein TadG